MKPGGLRMGSPAMTTRGFGKEDFVRVADVVHRAVGIAQRLDGEAKEEAKAKGKKGAATVKAFMDFVGEGEGVLEIMELKREVEGWVGTFGVPGIKEETH